MKEKPYVREMCVRKCARENVCTVCEKESECGADRFGIWGWQGGGIGWQIGGVGLVGRVYGVDKPKGSD